MQACADFTVAGAVSAWFFSRGEGQSYLAYSFIELLTHHLGSAAFGSFLIAFCRFLRFMLLVLRRQTQGQGNACLKFCIKCCSCFIKCIQNYLEYFTRLIYAVICEYEYCTVLYTVYSNLPITYPL